MKQLKQIILVSLIKSFLRITHLLVMKNWAHIHNFPDLVQLIAACGGKEIRTHLLSGPPNATYLSPDYIVKYINIIYEHVILPLLESLRRGHFSFYSDETSDITSVEQFTIYATFDHHGLIKEHFIGIVPLSKLVVSFKIVRYAFMGTTNVNSGEKVGLKAYIEDAVPMCTICCTSHKLALCFKHIIKDFPSVIEVDVFLLNLWKFFKYRTLAMNVRRFTEILNPSFQSVQVPPVGLSMKGLVRLCLKVTSHYRSLSNIV